MRWIARETGGHADVQIEILFSLCVCVLFFFLSPFYFVSFFRPVFLSHSLNYAAYLKVCQSNQSNATEDPSMSEWGCSDWFVSQGTTHRYRPTVIQRHTQWLSNDIPLFFSIFFSWNNRLWFLNVLFYFYFLHSLMFSEQRDFTLTLSCPRFSIHFFST